MTLYSRLSRLIDEEPQLSCLGWTPASVLAALYRCNGRVGICEQDGTQKSQKVFVNIPTEVGATEAEEIGTQALFFAFTYHVANQQVS